MKQSSDAACLQQPQKAQPTLSSPSLLVRRVGTTTNSRQHEVTNSQTYWQVGSSQRAVFTRRGKGGRALIRRRIELAGW